MAHKNTLLLLLRNKTLGREIYTKKIECLLSLYPDNRVPEKIRQINGMGLCPDVRMLTHQQPAHVSKEKAPFCIMWICIRLRELVMHTMITGPFKYIILEYRDFTTQN